MRDIDPTAALEVEETDAGKPLVSRRGVLKRAAIVTAGAGGASLLLSRRAFAAPTGPSNVVYLDEPIRLLDTRPDQPDAQAVQTGTAIGGGATRDFVVAGLGGISATASGVFGNLTVATPQSFGNFVMYPTGATVTAADAATLVFGSFVVGNYLANHAASRIGTLLSCTILNTSSAPAHAIFDAVGYIEQEV